MVEEEGECVRMDPRQNVVGLQPACQAAPVRGAGSGIFRTADSWLERGAEQDTWAREGTDLEYYGSRFELRVLTPQIRLRLFPSARGSMPLPDAHYEKL